jgi:hypothetical protein
LRNTQYVLKWVLRIIKCVFRSNKERGHVLRRIKRVFRSTQCVPKSNGCVLRRIMCVLGSTKCKLWSSKCILRNPRSNRFVLSNINFVLRSKVRIKEQYVCT